MKRSVSNSTWKQQKTSTPVPSPRVGERGCECVLKIGLHYALTEQVFRALFRPRIHTGSSAVSAGSLLHYHVIPAGRKKAGTPEQTSQVDPVPARKPLEDRQKKKTTRDWVTLVIVSAIHPIGTLQADRAIC